MADAGVTIRVLVNSVEGADIAAKHMRHDNKVYMSFEKSIACWQEMAAKYPGQMEVRVCSAPILRRYHGIFHRDAAHSTVNVRQYTYGNGSVDKNFQTIFTRQSDYFALYRGEFDYLWELSGKGAEGDALC